ncbi:SDR family NAD(P)-dependent oxidoreductase [Rhodococcus jostii]|uniref:Enoyl-(Acyl carrier protein) reductase n=1 Tax=Rhodococcus jostii TaxID=132919 RepID=A0A1H4YGZ0_RHOJO|nr:SDR family NAD(P)-dependent oxidoreductase [Rhodococcus jostii]SED17189.1 Enoyl-(Acyl carrier protein) reductase [Rhodococcus jostii]
MSLDAAAHELKPSATARFNGHTSIVVGGSKGIGKSTAERLAQEGSNVVIADIDPGVTETAATLAAEYPSVTVVGTVADITSLADCERVVSETTAQFGAFDSVVIAAGVVNNPADVVTLSEAEWNRVFAINVTGPFLFAKAALPVLKGQGHGRIVLIASFWGRVGQALFSAYCASKAAIIVLAQSLAAEVAGDGITVNTVAPGMTNTDLHRQALAEEAAKRSITFEEFRDQEYAHIPLGRSADPVDIANAVLFLTSDEARYVTGASIDVNGGVLFR